MLTRNAVIEINIEFLGLSGLYRILHIDTTHNAVVLFFLPVDIDLPDLDKFRNDNSTPTYSKPVLAHWDKLLEAEDKHNLRITKFAVPSYMYRVSSELSQAARAKQAKNWEIIKPLVNTGADLFFGKRGTMIKMRADEMQTTVKAIHRILYRYWHYGQSLSALIPASENSGGRDLLRTPGLVKRGRPRKAISILHDASLERPNTSVEDRRIFQRAIDLFHKAKNLSIPKTYQRMHERFYNNGYTEINGKSVPILKPAQAIPSIETFRYWFKKEQDEVAVKRARTHRRKWDMNFRGLQGSAQQDLFGPCERFEIDATIADVFLVNRYNRKYIIGRPTIYIVIDVFSRMIVGMYVGWKSPSWEGARLALLNAFTDKIAYCAKYGVLITHEDWPCYHLPQKILGDRGEIAGDPPEGMIESLDIQVELTATGRGDLKGVVESRFSIFNENTIHDLPGATTEEKRERGEPDPRLAAALNIEEFTSIMIRAILHHNHFSEKPHLLDKKMIADEVAPNPIHIWNWGLINATGFITAFDAEEVRIHLMRPGTATVYPDGIHFRGMRYTTALAIAENWFSLARMKKTWPVDIRYIADTDEVWLFDTKRGLLEPCTLLDADKRFQNMRLEEVINLLEYQKVQRDQRKDAASSNLAQIHAEDDAAIKRAKKQTKEERKGMSKAARTCDMRENRQVEQVIEATKDRIERNTSIPADDIGNDVNSQPVLPESTFEELRKKNQNNLLHKLRRKPAHGSS